MFARSAKAAFVAAALATTIPCAEAKKTTFATGSPFGVGLLAGLKENPTSNLIGAPQTTSASFSHFFGFEPFLDFGNFIIRGSGQLHTIPIYEASGTDSVGTFSESSDVGSFHYGAQLLLVPYISESKTDRAYIKLGFSLAKTVGKNFRNYATGATYRENFSGGSNEMLAGLGFEFFLVQNYSMQIEAGYRQLEFGSLTHKEGTNLQGTPKNSGELLLNADGINKKINHSGFYVSVGINLNL